MPVSQERLTYRSPDPCTSGAPLWYKTGTRSKRRADFCSPLQTLAKKLPMPRWNTVAIVGVGLIGGSIGMALRARRLAGRVVGIGRNAESLRKAIDAKAVTDTTLNASEGVRGADLVIYALPVAQIAAAIEQMALDLSSAALVTDVGSTKAAMVSQIDAKLVRKIRFIGSHPLAGGEKGGVAFASSHLFEGRVSIVTPTQETPKDLACDAREFWESLGSRVVVMSPEEHDDAVAAISHLPHLVASAVAGSTPERQLDLAAGGWRDTTRIAAGDPELWIQILLTNRGYVLKSLERFEKTVSKFKAALENEDSAALKQLLAEAKRIRDAVGS
jgi:prephenate dehydrogenase